MRIPGDVDAGMLVMVEVVICSVVNSEGVNVAFFTDVFSVVNDGNVTVMVFVVSSVVEESCLSE